LPIKSILLLVAILLAASAASRAQVVPAATRSASLTDSLGSPVNGSLHFDMRYSQTAQISGSQGDQQSSNVSGDASYANISERFPFSMQYGGGYGRNWVNSTGNVYQHLSLSQGVTGRTWNLSASDSTSYSFETPTTGFSGVAGSGEPIGGSGSTSLSDQSILAFNTRTIDNFVTIGFVKRLTSAWSLSTGGAFGQLFYVDGDGQDSNTLTAYAGVSRRLDAQDSVSGQYSFSRFNYSGAGIATVAGAKPISYGQTSSAQLSLSRQWNRQITSSVSAGPQWISSSNSATQPSTTSFSASASVSDTLRLGTASLAYNHGMSGGSGYMSGSKEDSVNANFLRSIGRSLSVGVTGSYMRTASLFASEFEYACTIDKVVYLCLVPLNYTPVTNSRYGGVQATRKLGRYFNVFANYTVVNQSSNLQITVPKTAISYNQNILRGTSQMLSFGIEYSPREMRLRR
jgi:hypothetical protein